jgi:arginine/serine-rich splicing factor 17
LRTLKSTLEYIRCEAEIENKSHQKALLAKLDGCVLKMASSYTDVLRVRAAEAKIGYPVRHDWESFFGNADQPSELWEKPDTVHFNDLPIRWFVDRSKAMASGDWSRPSEQVVRDVFGVFGEVRMVDVPMLSSSNARKDAAAAETFEAFVQYKDYISFVKAMDTFRGMKLLFTDGNEAYTANIRVN